MMQRKTACHDLEAAAVASIYAGQAHAAQVHVFAHARTSLTQDPHPSPL